MTTAREGEILERGCCCMRSTRTRSRIQSSGEVLCRAKVSGAAECWCARVSRLELPCQPLSLAHLPSRKDFCLVLLQPKHGKTLHFVYFFFFFEGRPFCFTRIDPRTSGAMRTLDAVTEQLYFWAFFLQSCGANIFTVSCRIPAVKWVIRWQDAGVHLNAVLICTANLQRVKFSNTDWALQCLLWIIRGWDSVNARGCLKNALICLTDRTETNADCGSCYIFSELLVPEWVTL